MRFKINRFLPCWCGSGKMHRDCHEQRDKSGYRGQAEIQGRGDVAVGLAADVVLKRLPKAAWVRRSLVVGREGKRRIVLWFYRGLTLEMRYRGRDGVSCYRVYKMWTEKEAG